MVYVVVYHVGEVDGDIESGVLGVFRKWGDAEACLENDGRWLIDDTQKGEIYITAREIL